MSNFQVSLLGLMFLKLLGKNLSITSKELKDFARKKYPNLKWNQKEISLECRQMAQTLNLPTVDNGTYLTYSVPETDIVKAPLEVVDDLEEPVEVEVPQTKQEKIDYLKKEIALEVLKEAKGTFITISWIENNGEERTINCQYHGIDNNGYVKAKTSRSQDYKLINPAKILKIVIKGVTYKV